MLKFIHSVGFLFAISPCVAVADTITQTVPFDYDGNFGVTTPVIQGFDTQGGTRQLTGVTFAFHHNFDIELFVESTGPTAVSDGDFLFSLSYISLYQLGLPGEKGDPPPPFFGPGAFFAGDISGGLAAYDGIPGNNGPDSFRRDLADSFTVVQEYTQAEPDVLAAVTGAGPITTILGGFSEIFFAWVNDPGWPVPPGGFPEYPSDAAIWISTPTLRHFGEIEITYEYIPEPTTATGLAGLALLLRRRCGGRIESAG